MSKTILSEINGFVPIIKDLVHEVGFEAAVAFGVVWCYCQMQDGLCRASLDTMANDLGWTRQRLARHIDPLVANGYIDEERRFGEPTRYYDTGKAGLINRVEGGVVTKRNNHLLQNVTTPVTKCNTNIILNKQEIEEGNPASLTGNDAPVMDAATKIFTDVTGMLNVPFGMVNAVYATIAALIGKYGVEGAREEVKKYYTAWRERGYSKLNTGWLDWALAGEIPVQRKKVSPPTEAVTDETTGGKYL